MNLTILGGNGNRTPLVRDFGGEEKIYTRTAHPLVWGSKVREVVLSSLNALNRHTKFKDCNRLYRLDHGFDSILLMNHNRRYHLSTSSATAAVVNDINPLNSSVMGKESQAQTQTPIQLHQDTTGPASTATTVTTQAGATTTELANGPSRNPSPTTKIPFRPRKIRKLSPNASDVRSPQTDAAEKTKSTTTTTKTTKNKIVALPPKPIPRIVARSLSCDGEMEIALRHLRSADPQLAPLIDIHHPPTFDSSHPPFLALAKSILYQQLAYKAGTSIYTRFVSLCGGEAGVLPDTVLALTPQQLRQVGVSGRKASYLHDLSRKYQNGILSDSSVVEMDDKSLFTMLTMVNGIGSWSVHMFMISSLHRPDVLPVNDLGVRKGVQLLYGLEELPRPSKMEQLCEKWRPYRSVGSWYMWRCVEAKGVPSSAAPVAAAGTSLQLQQQQQQQPQFLDPINGILDIGACAWGQ